MKRFHVFYTWAYGMQARYEVFDTVEQVEAFYGGVHCGEELSHIGLRIIYGELCEFEPVKVVERWRLKEFK